MTTGSETTLAPKRRWLQFSLRSLLIITAILSVLLGWLGSILFRVRQQRDIVSRIESIGGKVYYDYQVAGEHIKAKPPPGPKLIRLVLGDDAFARVEVVHLLEAKTKDEHLVWLTKLPELNYIILNGPDITDEGMKYVAEIAKLRGLGLFDTNVTAHGLACLNSAEHFVSLSLDGSMVNDDMLEPLNALPHLQFLQLVRTNVTSAGLVHLSKLTQLRELDILEGRQIGGDGLQHLKDLSNLERLQVFYTSVSDDGLRHLRGLRRLRSLNLDGTTVSDSGIEHLCGLRELTHLDLAGTKVGDAGLGRLLRLERLDHLDLTQTAVTDAGAVHLAKMKRLRWLEIDGTKVSDDGMLRLGPLKNLELLRVGSGVTKRAARKLKDSLPNCSIEYVDKNGSMQTFFP